MATNREDPADEPTSDLQAAADQPSVAGARIAELEAEAEALRTKLRETEGRLRTVSKAFVDQKDEMAAFRTRIEDNENRKLARREFEVAGIFFAPVQNLQRSVEVGVQDAEAFLEGIRIIHHQFVEGLHKLGLDAVPGVGAPFDPELHEALAMTPVSDEAQDGIVLLVHEEGFMVGGRALQAAKVVVGKYQADAPETPEA